MLIMLVISWQFNVYVASCSVKCENAKRVRMIIARGEILIAADAVSGVNEQSFVVVCAHGLVG